MPTEPSSPNFRVQVAAQRARARRLLCRPACIFSVCLCFAATIGGARAFGQAATCATLQAAEKKTYGFNPVALSSSQQTIKSGEVQRFRDQAKGMGASGVSCLRQMLARNTDDPYFLYSGSVLLLSLDSSPDSLSAILMALANTDPSLVDASGYIGLLIQLARRNVDAGPLAGKYVNYVALHDAAPQGEVNDQLINATLLLYGSMPPDLAVTYLGGLLKYGEANARPAALFALALNLTEPAFRQLHGGVTLTGLSDDNRKVVLSVLTYKPMTAVPHTPLSRDDVLKRLDAVTRGDFSHIDANFPPYVSGDQAFEVSAGAQLTPADLPRLLQARRMSIHGVTEESLDDYLTLTRTILEVIDRYDLYRKWRMTAAEAREIGR